ncbi:MAG: hypothetical protein ABIV25_04190 [Paracoccaceae bacterium]
MKLWLLALAVAAGPAWADDKLDAAAITATLTGKSVVYDDGTKQLFKPDGQTIFDNGRQSMGQWAVREDQYCSVWPPSDVWACYDVMTGASGAVSFVAADGSATAGHFAP